MMESVDTPEFRALLRGLIGPDGEVWPQVIAHIDSLIEAQGDSEYARGFIDGQAKTDVMRQKWNKASAERDRLQDLIDTATKSS